MLSAFSIGILLISKGTLFLNRGERAKKLRRVSTRPLIERIEELRIFEENLVRERRRDVFARPHSGDKLALLRWILMTVVRADDQVIRACILRNVLDILVCLAGDKNAVFAEHVHVRREFPLFPE